MKKLNFIILFSILIVVSCENTEEYSEIPDVKFKDFVFDVEDKHGFVNQVGLLTFEFIDGDGNLGFYENADTTIDTVIYDVFIYEFSKRNGVFFPSDTEKYWLPYFSEGIYRKHIKGELEFRIYLYDQINDTVKYEFQIMDRDNNTSNMETSPELIVPEWR